MSIKQDDKSLVRTIVAYSIKNSLQKMGFGHLEKVMEQLDSNYRIFLFDSFDYPEILKKILNSLYGKHCWIVINSIEYELGKLSNQKPYSEFLNSLRIS